MDDGARGDAPGKFIKLRRGITHYRRFGPEEGPLVVCVHGLTTPSFVFEGIAEAYVKNDRVVWYMITMGREYSDRPVGLQNRAFLFTTLKSYWTLWAKTALLILWIFHGGLDCVSLWR